MHIYVSGYIKDDCYYYIFYKIIYVYISNKRIIYEYIIHKRDSTEQGGIPPK